MRDHLVVIAVLVGCGRVGFDPHDDATSLPVGHDEDGDGVRDIDDVCPYLPGSQLDGDGDRVGDDCDPNPTVPRDTIAVFATMMPGDQPFALFGDGAWTQLADAIEHDGPPDMMDGHMSGHLELAMPLADVRIAVGFDILDRVVPGSQWQFAVGVRNGGFVYYTQFNEIPAQFARADIVAWDGANFVSYALQDLATGIHTGRVEYQATHRVGTSSQFDAGWPGEPYRLESMEGQYQGGDKIDVNTNNLHLQIRYACVITSS